MSRSRVPVESKISTREALKKAITELEEAAIANRNVGFGRRIAEILIDVRELERRITVTIPSNQDPAKTDPA
jgi:hypothetical protein